MQNMSKTFKGLSSKITSTPCNQLTLCNWRVKEECSMDVKWQTMDAIYNCRDHSPEPPKIYFVLAEGKIRWKKRYYNRKTSFNHKRYSHETTSLASEGIFRWNFYLWMVSSEVRHTLSQTSHKSVFCVYMKNWLLLPIQDNTNF